MWPKKRNTDGIIWRLNHESKKNYKSIRGLLLCIGTANVTCNPSVILMISIEEQIECVKREIGMRHRVYPNWISINKMTQEKASYEIETMKEVLITLMAVQNNKQNFINKTQHLGKELFE